MKKEKVATVAIMFLVFAAHGMADDFAPTVMTLSAPPIVHYDFDGRGLEIPATVSGTPALAIFTVFTKDRAPLVDYVTNGYLGWHTVNRIDTCIYFSAPKQLARGENSILWDGRDQDGGTVPPGDYTYYLFAYDNRSPKTLVCDVLDLQRFRNNTFVTHDHRGNPLGRPLFYPGINYPIDQHIKNEGEITRSKWTIGSDPLDASLVETTSVISYNQYGGLVPSPYEADMFFSLCASYDPPTGRIRKYSWIPGGRGELRRDWCDNGEVVWPAYGKMDWDIALNDLTYPGGDILIASNTSHFSNRSSELVLVDARDGEIVRTIDVSEWWVRPEDEDAGAQMSGGPNVLEAYNGLLFMGAHSSCLNQVIDPFAGEEPEDYVRWINGNGDYVGDHNFEETSHRPWVCNDFMCGPQKYHISADASLFSAFPAYMHSFYIGSADFGLYAPDGTGIGYFMFDSPEKNWKHEFRFIDYGSAYDGIYTHGYGVSHDDNEPGLWYHAHDSIRGVITSGSADEAPSSALLVVAQNSPEPCCSKTAIRFSTARAGRVKVNVLDTGGRTVDILLDTLMDVGVHEVVWDASDHAAGRYYCTVSLENISKTIAMSVERYTSPFGKRLTDDGINKHMGGDWSPDGKWIAYTLSEKGIYIIPADGGEAVCLDDDKSSRFTCFSPDSKEVYYTKGSMLEPSIMCIDIETRESSTFLHNAAHGRWSRDGRYFVFLRDYDPQKIMVYDSSSNKSRVVCENYDDTSAFPCSSPDNTFVIASLGTLYDCDLYGIPLDGGKPERLTSDKGNEYNPLCTPDGRWIVYMHFPAAAYANIIADVCVYDTVSRQSKRLFPETQKLRHANSFLSPDGSRICYPRYVLDNDRTELYVADFEPENPPETHFTVLPYDTLVFLCVDIPSGVVPTIDGEPIEAGDEIGVFTPRGVCVGMGVWKGEAMQMLVWGDHYFEAGTLGFLKGEPLTFRIWDWSSRKEYSAEAAFTFEKVDNWITVDRFRAGRVSRLASLQAVSTGAAKRGLQNGQY